MICTARNNCFHARYNEIRNIFPPIIPIITRDTFHSAELIPRTRSTSPRGFSSDPPYGSSVVVNCSFPN